MARWVDYYLGRRGGPRAHPTGQPGAMAPQRRGAVAAPTRDPTRQATCHAAGTILHAASTTPFHHANIHLFDTEAWTGSPSSTHPTSGAASSTASTSARTATPSRSQSASSGQMAPRAR
jgi:hypothetical protein